MSRSLRLFIGPLLVVIAAVAYWQSLPYQPTTLANGAQFTPTDCWFEKTSSIRIECGYFSTRAPITGSARFRLPVVILRHSLWHNSKSPMLHLAGGPGGAAYLDADTMPYWIQNFIDQDWGVDFVLYDQRGTGLSQPSLRCPNTHQQRLQSLLQPLNASEDSQQFVAQMQACYRHLSTQPALTKHLGLISTDFSVQDIADLHDVLEIEQWVLMGVSYGTRLALEMVRQHPERVRSMVLDSVYPPEFDGFETLVENGFSAVQRLVNYCGSDIECDEQFPELSVQLYAALLKLADSPVMLQVPQASASESSRTLLLTAHRLILLLDYASYDALALAEVPAAIAAANRGDVGNTSLLTLANNYLDIELFDEFSEPVYMITECKENGAFDVSRLQQRLLPYQVTYPMLDWSTLAIFNPRMCQGWQGLSTAATRDYRQPVISDKPTLILSGALDSVTPPEWGRRLAKRLSHSRYLEYPNAAHSVLTSSLCSNDEVQLFLNPELEQTAFCNASHRVEARTTALLNWAGLAP